MNLPAGCEWAFVEPLDPILSSAVLGVLAHRGDHYECLGSGVVLRTLREEGTALGVTAFHVINNSFGRDRKRENIAPGFAPFWDPSLVQPCKDGRLVAHVHNSNRCAGIAQLIGGEGTDAWDTAILHLKQDDVFRSSSLAIAFNGDLVPPGTNIIVAGLTGQWVQTQLREGKQYVEISHTPEVRAGKIRAVHARHRYLRCPVYEITSPIPHGMSGGPVFLAPQPGEPMTLIGFCSYGPPSEHEYDPTVPGEGYVVPIKSVYAHALNNVEGGFTTFLDMIQAGLLRDVGSDWRDMRVKRTFKVAEVMDDMDFGLQRRVG